MKRLALVLMLVAGSANAQWNYDNSAGREFDVSKNQLKSVTITWHFVDENKVTETCHKESLRVGNKGFQYQVQACAFQWVPEKRCTIITARNVSMRTIGHEMMHCFQGNWHPE